MTVKSLKENISPVDIAWAAGIFEGEGCFSTFPNQNNTRRYIGLQVNMTDEDVVERLYNVFGVGTFAPWHPPSHRESGRKPQYRWRVSGKNAEAVFWLIAPHLGKRRIARFMELLSEVVTSNVTEVVEDVA